MEQQLLSLIPTLIPTVGFGGVACIYLWKYINKKDEQNREDTKEQIKELREENKEDKRLFQSAIDSFNVSVIEFKNVQQETNSIKSDLIEVKQDLIIIKDKVNK